MQEKRLSNKRSATQYYKNGATQIMYVFFILLLIHSITNEDDICLFSLITR